MYFQLISFIMMMNYANKKNIIKSGGAKMKNGKKNPIKSGMKKTKNTKKNTQKSGMTKIKNGKTHIKKQNTKPTLYLD